MRGLISRREVERPVQALRVLDELKPIDHPISWQINHPLPFAALAGSLAAHSSVHLHADARRLQTPRRHSFLSGGRRRFFPVAIHWVLLSGKHFRVRG